jgi:hypothetical protein
LLRCLACNLRGLFPIDEFSSRLPPCRAKTIGRTYQRSQFCGPLPSLVELPGAREDPNDAHGQRAPLRSMLRCPLHSLRNIILLKTLVTLLSELSQQFVELAESIGQVILLCLSIRLTLA